MSGREDVLAGLEGFSEEPWALFDRGRTLAVFDSQGHEIIHWTGFDSSSATPEDRRRIADVASRGPRLVDAIRELRTATRELLRGATRVQDAAVTPLGGETHRYMGERVIVDARRFEALLDLLPDTPETDDAE